MREDNPKQSETSLKDLELWALDHYKKVSDGAHDWMNVIPRAISFYYAALGEFHKEQAMSFQIVANRCPFCNEGTIGNVSMRLHLLKCEVFKDALAKTTEV